MPLPKIHRTFVLLTALLVTPFSLSAQDSNTELTAALFTYETPKEFSLALAKAEKENIPRQTILEAKFLFYVDQQDHASLAKLSTELLSFGDSFTPTRSQIFTLRDDWQAIVHYTQSLAALENGDTLGFKKHITEAFWLSPRQASAFAPHIEQLKLDQAMAEIVLKFDTRLANLTDGTPSEVLTKDASATILYFWSPWSRDFAENLDGFKELSTYAKKRNIQLNTILAENAPKVEADAKMFIKENNLTDTATWLKESPTMELSTQLRIQNIPTIVLVSKSGNILFNGHPSSPKLNSKFERIPLESK